MKDTSRPKDWKPLPLGYCNKQSMCKKNPPSTLRRKGMSPVTTHVGELISWANPFFLINYTYFYLKSYVPCAVFVFQDSKIWKHRRCPPTSDMCLKHQNHYSRAFSCFFLWIGHFAMPFGEELACN